MTDKNTDGGAGRRDLRADLDRLAGRRGASDFSKQEFRKRLERLRDIEKRSAAQADAGRKRATRAAAATAGQTGSLRYGRMVAATAPTQRRHRGQSDAPPVVLTEALPCLETEIAGTGRLLLVEEHVAQLDGGFALNTAFSEQLVSDGSSVRSQLCPLLPADEPVPTLEEMVFMDVESTGLGSNPLFLIGVMVWEGEGFVVKQFFARSYAEERAVVAAFLSLMESRRLLITFNGKSFDWPYIKARAAATGAARQFREPLHLDLLHAGRRAWKQSLPNCKLQTLERFICGRTRTGDIPSAEIPEAYHAYVRTGDAFEMVPAMKHNKLDLVTLADLMTRFPVPHHE